MVGLAILAILESVMPAGAVAQWGPLGAGLSGTAAFPGVVYLHVWDGKLVAAGRFSSAGGAPAHNIAIWDGTQWAPLADGWDFVRGIATYNGQLVVAGTRPDSLNAEIAAWDGSTWTTVVETNSYGGLIGFNGKLYQTVGSAAGNAVQMDLCEYDGVGWTSIRNWASSDHLFTVKVMTIIDTSLYTYVEPWGDVDSYDGISWTSHGSTVFSVGMGLVDVNGQLYAGGYDTIGWPRVSLWSGTTWDLVYTSSECGIVTALTEFGGELIVAGHFNAACGPPYTRVASWDGVAWDSVGGDMNAGVSSFAAYEGKLIAAGGFTEAGGVPISLIAQLNDVPTPVAISAFAARHRSEGVELAWEIAADEAFDGFHVYRSENDGSDELVNSSILATTVRSYVDHTPQPGARYSYFLVAVGATSGEVRSQRVEIVLPAVTAALHQNAPNPFNPVTTIRFVVPGNDHVSIDIFSAAGQRVRTLVNAPYPAGEQSATWDGTDDSGQRVASGVYLYRMRIGKQEFSRKMTVLK